MDGNISIIEPLRVGCDEITDLQFVNDMMLFCSNGDVFILNHKCQIFGINYNTDKLGRWASMVGCEVRSFSSCYLGLPLGANSRACLLKERLLFKGG